MKRISILYAAVGIGIFAIAISAVAQNQFKLGVVDTQKVFEGYKSAKAADEVLENCNRTNSEPSSKMSANEILTMEERLTKAETLP